MSALEKPFNGPDTKNQCTEPWYRQFWPWFLIALPLAAVLGAVVTLFLAVASPDRLIQRAHHQTLGPVITETRNRRED